MICSLCKGKEANKKNTHYLTDSIIRTCLNEDEKNERGKGHYFDVSNTSLFFEFNFQQNTSIERLEKTLGRQPTEEEIEKARSIPFSVDFVFCSDCEKIFTDIETAFTDKYLKKFRNEDLDGRSDLTIEDYATVKLFFLLQVWRSAICEDIYKLDENISEKLRVLILNYKTMESNDLKEFPLTVTYLQTKNVGGGYGLNKVGYTSDKEPNLIFMNDFVIQFFSSSDKVKYFDFYNLNKPEDFENFLNVEGDNFIFKIIKDEDRKKFLKDIDYGENIKTLIPAYRESFIRLYIHLFRSIPHPILVDKFMTHLISGDEANLLKYNKENILEKVSSFFDKYLKN